MKFFKNAIIYTSLIVAIGVLVNNITPKQEMIPNQPEWLNIDTLKE